MRKYIFSIIFFVFSVGVMAQEDEKNFSLHWSYFGETITHPGTKIGVDYPLRTTKISKLKKSGKTFDKQKQIIVGGNLGVFYQRRYNTSLFLNAEVGYRRIKKKGSKLDFLFGVGYLKSFLNEDTYEVSDNGEVNRVRLAGQSSFLSSISVSFGKDFGFTGSSPWGYHIKPSLYFQMPYGQVKLPHFVLECGVSYTISCSTPSK